MTHTSDTNIAAETALLGQETVLFDLASMGLIRFHGEDTQTFLQGQLTNDIRALKNDKAQLSAYCTPKGRMQASFILWQSDAGVHAMLPLELTEAIRKRLSMFIMRSKVKADDVTAQVRLFALLGAQAEATLQELMGSCPTEAFAVSHTATGSIIRLPQQFFLIAVPAEQAEALHATLAGKHKTVHSHAFDWWLVQAGIPMITPPTQEQFVPQMTNYEVIGGVNFKKGCYPGQEIVARTQYLGKLKRRMYHIALPADSQAAVGDELYGVDMGDQAIGMLVNIHSNAAGQMEALAVIQIGSVEAGPIRHKAPDGVAIELLSLPYHVD